MSSSLSRYVVDAFDDKTFSQLAKPTAQLAARLERVAVKQGLQFDGELKKSVYIWAGAGIVLLHLAAVWAYLNYEEPAPTIVPKHEVAIEFIKPETPPPVVEPPPPPPPPPPPKVQKVAPPPQPIAALKTAPAVENVAPTDLTVQENTKAESTSAPVMAASGPLDKNAEIPEPAPPVPPAPPAPKVEEPITEASANAGYLNNPKPDYPGAALRNGWGGTVILRVRVLASGAPESATVKKSTGKKVLDDAAVNTVMKWTFVPSKRGSTPIDGWATVPIIFNPEQ
jgi:protein TonB